MALSKNNNGLFYREESPHPESSLEWWYVHGWLDGPGFTERPFMVSFFRHNLHGNSDSHSFLMAIQGKDSGKHFTKSWITPSLVSQTKIKTQSIRELNLDGLFIDSFFQEFEKNGPPREISLIDEAAKIQTSPFSISWKDFILEQTPQGFFLSFQDPDSSLDFKLQLQAQKKPVNLKNKFYSESSPRQMDYICYTKLAVDGKVGEDAVSGTAWLDHQWGEHTWFFQEEETMRTLGWDFFGFCLDDFTDFSMLIHRDTATGKVCEQSIMKHDKEGRVESTSRFSARPVRYWESPASAIRHPLEWDFLVPEWDMQFRFRPKYDSQEIPVFGLQRTIWQGAGSVEGNWKGSVFQAKARGELQGYGFIQDPNEYLKTMADRIDRHIADFLPEKLNKARLESFLGEPTWDYEPANYQKMLSDPVWDLLSRKGKRWRPIFAILLLDALGTPPHPYEALISTLAELAHSGSLIIDDIQDASAMRRGRESIHILYGQDVAISAANTLYFLCTHLLFGHPHLTRDQQLDIHEEVIKQFTRAHFGQAQDLFWSRNLNQENLEIWLNDSLEGKILQMYELKTASPIQGLAAAASIIHGTSPETKAACINYSRDLGVAFQIIDDIHNFSRSPKWRKEPAEDISEGKITYVIFKALTALNNKHSSRLKKILTSPELRCQPELRNEAADLVRDSGVFSSCRERALSMVESAWGDLSQYLEASHAKILLQMMVGKLIQTEIKGRE
jgi:geranylgeranyl pyrophosphate synthase/predicted secreted hydrolase